MSEQNNINRELCEYLVNLGQDLANAKSQPTRFEMQGKQFMVLAGESEEIRIRDPHVPQRKTIFTLQGLVDFIKADVDHLFGDPDRRHIVSVMSPECVSIFSPLIGEENIRHEVARCAYEAEHIGFGRQMTQEDFVVMLQSRFEDTDSRALVLKVIKKGVVTNGETSFKNPAYLQPIRTFTEVEQPESPFVLRVTPGDPEKKTPVTVALHECDGGAWKIKAVQTIGRFLKDALADCNVEVIA